MSAWRVGSKVHHNVYAGDRPVCQCHNAEDAARIVAAVNAAEVLKKALRRNREGYANILEFRKLSGEQWGQRDGYGGRYGALTREELEACIAEIDEALARAEEKP